MDDLDTGVVESVHEISTKVKYALIIHDLEADDLRAVESCHILLLYPLIGLIGQLHIFVQMRWNLVRMYQFASACNLIMILEEIPKIKGS